VATREGVGVRKGSAEPGRKTASPVYRSTDWPVFTRRITLGLEFHADLVFWRLLIFDGLGSVGGTLGAPLIWSFPQTPTYTLWSDASGDAMGGWFLEAGASSGV